MGIKANNLVVTKKPEIEKESVGKAAAEERKLIMSGGAGTKLVVDGKVKNISKKSAFLLDMLTLDDDQPK